MACMLAGRLKRDLPKAQMYAFPLVGKGKVFEDAGIEVYPPPFDTPSGGVIKYSFSELMKDIRAGLFGHIKRQLDAWSRLRGTIRTPLCVGDVYLLLHALWGQGMPPILLATAKTVYLRGHLVIERWILKNKARRVWTRDEMTAVELKKSSVDAVYAGNPIMDLASDNNNEADEALWPAGEGYRVLLLPGSRQDAYNDVKLLLRAAELVSRELKASFLMVIAPSIEWHKMASSLEDYSLSGDILEKDDLKVKAAFCPVSAAARRADVLLGLGGTANGSSKAVAPQQMTGAQAVVRSLEELDVDTIFGIPGGAVLPVYDPLFDSKKVRHVLVRHEQGAGHAASGYAHATGKVGVMMATSGPGATNLVTPLADAQMDSIPVVAITGQVGRGLIGTDAFQEADISGITMPITKHNFLVRNGDDIAKVIAETASTGSTAISRQFEAVRTAAEEERNPRILTTPGRP